MSAQENKIVKAIMESLTLIGLATGIGYVARKVLKQSFIGDPSSNVENFGKWVLVLARSSALKDYLETQKILPKPT